MKRLLLLILLFGCVMPGVIELKGVEVRDYQGEDLSSVNDFRENSIKGPQSVNIDSYSLVIDGLVNKPLSLSYDEVLDYQSYSKVVTLHCVEGWSATILWEGVLLSDLLDTAGVLPEANTVIFYAVDGYTTSLSLVEASDKLLAYKMNNVTLPAERGFPFQLVAEDKWGYKWIKWVNRIELSNDSSYHGFWEQRGYNNVGNLNESKFD